MRYEPWTPKQKPKSAVFVVDANASLLELCTEDGGSRRYTTVSSAESALAGLRNTVLYSLVTTKQLVLFGGAQNWKVIKYHERIQRMEYKGKISFHAWAAFGPDPQELIPFFDALRGQGISPASMSTMALNSWKRVIPRRYNVIEWGSGTKVGRSAFLGGRKEAIGPLPATYSGAIYLDLPAAYLQAMAFPIPVYLRETTDARWQDEGICEALVDIPEQAWNPLPFRIGRGKRGLDLEVYGYGKAKGIFVISELRNAVDNHGVKAELVRVWKGYKPKELFKEWLPWALDLRKLPGNSGHAAKQMTTRLWSLFGQNPSGNRKIEITFEDAKGERKIRTEVASHVPARAESTVFLSALITSRVRVRVLEELLPAGAVYVDTDGGIVPSTVVVPGWATKRVMDTVEIRSSQAYRWQCNDCPNCEHRHNKRHPSSPWHYSVAGMRVNDPFLPDIFERMNRHQLLRMASHASVAIPAQSVKDARRWIEDQEIEAMPDETL